MTRFYTFTTRKSKVTMSEDDVVIAEYQQALLERPHVVARRRSPTGFKNQITEAHLNMNNKWGKVAFDQGTFSYSIVEPCLRVDSIPKRRHTGSNPSKEDLTTLKGKLEEPEIQRVLKLNRDDDLSGTVPLMTTVAPSKWIGTGPDFIPPNASRSPFGYIAVSLGELTIPHDSNWEGVSGYIQLYNVQTMNALSEPIHFRLGEGMQVLLSQTISSTVYFEIPAKTDAITLICVLKARLPSVGVMAPVAFGVLKLFEADGKPVDTFGFPVQWFSLSINDPVGTMQNCLSTSDQQHATVKVLLKVEIKYIECLETDFTYSWSRVSNNYFLADKFVAPAFEPTPMIEVFDIQLMGKIPNSAMAAYFVAYVCTDVNLKTPKSLPLFCFPSDSGKLSTSYVSTAVATSQTADFLDTLRVYLDEQPKPTLHLLLHVFFIDKNTQQGNLSGICIIPMYQEEKPLGYDIYRFSVYDLKSLPKKPLGKTKGLEKLFIQCKVRLPAAYFPPPQFMGVVNAEMAEQVLPPRFGELTPDAYQKQVLPMTGKLLSLIAPNTARQLLAFYDKLICKELTRVVKSWVYHVFSPQNMQPDFIDRLCDSFAAVLSDNAKQLAEGTISDEEERSFLRQIGFTLPLILDILIVSISTPQMKWSTEKLLNLLEALPNQILICTQRKWRALLMNKGEGLEKRRSMRDSMFNMLVPQKIVGVFEKGFSARQNVETAATLNTAFAEILWTLIPILPFPIVSGMIATHLRNLIQAKRKSTMRGAYSYLIFDFLSPFAQTEQFLVQASVLCKEKHVNTNISPYSPILSLMFLAFEQSIHANEAEALEMALKLFLTFLYSVEKAPKPVVERATYMLFPLVSLIADNFGSMPFTQNAHLRNMAIPVVLTILRNTTVERLNLFISGMISSAQSQFVHFLQAIVETIVNEMNMSRMSSKSPHLGTLELFNVVTQHILLFLISIVDVLGGVLPPVITLLSTMYNDFQSTNVIPLYFQLCTKMIDKYSCQADIISWLLSLLTATQHETRCFAAAVLILVFKGDYETSKTVVVSSVDFMDALTAVLLAIPLDSIPIYKTFIERVMSIIKTFEIPALTQLVTERMEASNVIIEVVAQQKASQSPPEVRCQQIMRIADQYKMFPSMRWKWLLEIVKINKESNNYISAFITQLHIVAMIETVLRLKAMKRQNPVTQDQELPEYYLATVQPIELARRPEVQSFILNKQDFSFMTHALIETDIDLSGLGDNALTLLSDFDGDALLKAIDDAIALGNDAELSYSLRPLLSLKIRLLASMHNYTELSEAFGVLASTMSKIMAKSAFGYDPTLIFYLVENVTDDGIYRQIYTLPEKSSTSAFIDTLSSANRFGEGNVKFVEEPWHEGLGKGVYVVKVTQVDEPQNRHEFRHCWTKFRYVPPLKTLSNDSLFSIHEYITKDPLPHYRWGDDVISARVIQTKPREFADEFLREAKARLIKCAEDFEFWFALSPFQPNEETRARQRLCQPNLKRIGNVLRDLLEGSDSISTVLSILNQDEANKEYVTEVANELVVLVNRCVSVYRRAVAEFTGDQTNSQYLMLCDRILDKFIESFGTEKVEKTSYSSGIDPLDDGIHYTE